MKPKPPQAMQALIKTIRNGIPFDTPESTLCMGPCQGCSKKLIEFLDDELSHWQVKLDKGDVPKLGEIAKLGRTAHKIQRLLSLNGFFKE